MPYSICNASVESESTKIINAVKIKDEYQDKKATRFSRPLNKLIKRMFYYVVKNIQQK